GVMKWMRERDLLIAQTMAFVQSVTDKKPDGEKPVAFSAATSDLPAPAMPDIEAMLAEAIANPEPPKPLQISRPALRSEYQNEIQGRVGDFSRASATLFERARRLLQHDHGQGAKGAEGASAVAAGQVSAAALRSRLRSPASNLVQHRQQVF